MTTDVQSLYTRRASAYVAFVSAFWHQRGLQAVLASSEALRPRQRILDAGCGTGLSTLALLAALRRKSFDYQSIDAFDITPAMLERCQRALDDAGVERVQLRRADVAQLDHQLPPSWNNYDLIICASMLEYVARSLFPASLAALRGRLSPSGQLIFFLTRRQMFLTRWIWRCEGYSRHDVAAALAKAGFTDIRFTRYPWTYWWLNVHNHVVEAGGGTG